MHENGQNLKFIFFLNFDLAKMGASALNPFLVAFLQQRTTMVSESWDIFTKRVLKTQFAVSCVKMQEGRGHGPPFPSCLMLYCSIVWG